MEQVYTDAGRPINGTFAGGGLRVQPLPPLAQARDCPGAVRPVGQQRLERRHDIRGGEVILDQLRHNAASGNQVRHGDVRHGHEPPRDRITQLRQPVDHDKRIPEQRSFHGSGSAGHDRRARMIERCPGVIDEHWPCFARPCLHCRRHGFPLQRGRHRHQVLIRVAKRGRGFEHGGQVQVDLAFPASRQQGHPRFGRIQPMLASECLP